MGGKDVVKNKTLIVGVVAAAVGGMAPNLMSLAIQLITGDGELPQYTYLLGLMIFALLGGAVGFFWREIDPKRAFYLGLGLPSLIQISINDLGGQSAPDFPSAEIVAPVSSRGGTPFSLTSTAVAESNESPVSAIPGRKVLIEIDRRFFAWKSITGQLAVLYEHYDRRSPTRVPLLLLSTFTDEQKKDAETANRVFALQLDIPETAKTFRIRLGRQTSSPATLSATPHQGELYQLRYIGDTWSGFMQAIGQRSAITYRIDLHRSGPATISFDNHAKFIEKRGEYNWFQWETFVDANQVQLDDITKVEYKLHKTVSPQPPATNRSAKFAVTGEGWGSFWVHAIAYQSNKKQTHIQYYLDLRKG